MYSTIPAWNADQSYLILYRSQRYSSSGLSSGWQLYNGKTYKFIRELNIAPSDVENVYWSSTDPDIFYYIADYGVPVSDYRPVLVRYSASKGTSTVIHSFAANLPAATPDNDKVDFGHILYMDWANTLVGTRDIITGESGRQAIESQSYSIASGVENGWPYPPVTTHISSTSIQNQGWVGVSIVGDPKGQNLLDSTLLLANINTSAVCGVAHTHSNGSGAGSGIQGYWAEPHVVISPSGTRLLFGSDWGSRDKPSATNNSVDTFVVELPSYKP